MRLDAVQIQVAEVTGLLPSVGLGDRQQPGGVLDEDTLLAVVLRKEHVPTTMLSEFIAYN